MLYLADPSQNAADNREAADAVAEMPQFQYLDAPIRRRKVFSNSGGQQLSVLELAPTMGAACRTI